MLLEKPRLPWRRSASRNPAAKASGASVNGEEARGRESAGSSAPPKDYWLGLATTAA
jgi:hypothetical protein